ncbi:MAG: transposase [Thermodesulfobacteriota bacterium]
MSRPLRIEYPNAFYHVMNRGLRRQLIYETDDDYEIFLETVKESSKFFDIRVISYCLMPNHYHLLLQTPRANLSRAMRHLNGVYTQRFNKLHKKDGPLFRGRYKAILVQEDEYLTHLIRYIHLNPVQANLTQDLSKYPWTSHPKYLKAEESDWLYARLGLSFFSGRLRNALKSYREFLKNGVDPRTRSFYSKKKQNPIFGDPDFIEMIREKYILGDQKLSTEVPEKRSYHGQKMAESIARESSKIFQAPLQSLGHSKRGETNHARLAAIHLTRELSGLRLSEIAEVFGMNSYKSVSASCHRLNERLHKEKPFKRRYERLKLACSQEET